MTRDQYQALLYRYFPKGPIWPSEPGDQPEWDALIDALSGAPASLDASAVGMLAEIFPDTTEDFLEHWEALVGLPDAYSQDGETVEQRRNAVLAKLAYLGRVNINDLEDIMRTMRGGDVGFRLLHHIRPPFQVGISGAHSAVGCAWAAVWACEYITNRISSASDDFAGAGWVVTGSIVRTDGAARSPITLQPTAVSLEMNVDTHIDHTISNTANGDSVRVSVWLRDMGTSHPASNVRVAVVGRDSAVRDIYLGPVGSWAKIAGAVTVGSGAAAPKLRIQAAGADQDFYASWARAGIRDTTFESRAALLAPINTRPEYRVIGETLGAIEALTLGGEIITLGGEAITAEL